MRSVITLSVLTAIVSATPISGVAADTKPRTSTIAVVTPAESRVRHQDTASPNQSGKAKVKLEAPASPDNRAKVGFVLPDPQMDAWIAPAGSSPSAAVGGETNDQPTLRIATRPRSLASSLVVKKEVVEQRVVESRAVVREREPAPVERPTVRVAVVERAKQPMQPDPPPMPRVEPNVNLVDGVEKPAKLAIEVPIAKPTELPSQPTQPSPAIVSQPSRAVHEPAEARVAATTSKPTPTPQSRVVATTPEVAATPVPAPPAVPMPSPKVAEPVVVAESPVESPQPMVERTLAPAAPSVVTRYPAPVAYRAPAVPPAPNRGYYVPQKPAVPFGGRGLPPAANSAMPRPGLATMTGQNEAYSPPMTPPSLEVGSVSPYRQASFSSVAPDSLPMPVAAPMPRANEVVPSPAAFEHGDLVDNSSVATCKACGVPLTSCTGPCWIVDAEAMFLGRDDPDTRTPLVTEFETTPPSVKDFSPSDASLGAGFGYRLGITRQLCSGSAINVQYFSVTDWTQSESFFGDLDVLGNSIGDPGFADWQYGSDLTNLEINGRYAINPWLGLIGGFRWIELDESASLNAGGPSIASFRRRISVDNTLLGGQMGLDYLLFDMGGVFRVDTTLKVGIFNNEMDLSSSGFGVGRRTENQIAAAGDFQLRGIWQIAPSLSITGGYYLLGISDLALAPEQFDDPSNINDDGDVIIQGGTLGLMWVY